MPLAHRNNPHNSLSRSPRHPSLPHYLLVRGDGPAAALHAPPEALDAVVVLVAQLTQLTQLLSHFLRAVRAGGHPSVRWPLTHGITSRTTYMPVSRGSSATKKEVFVFAPKESRYPLTDPAQFLQFQLNNMNPIKKGALIRHTPPGPLTELLPSFSSSSSSSGITSMVRQPMSFLDLTMSP